MAEDAAYTLSQGEPANYVIATSKVEMSRSLAAFIIFCDEARKAVALSGFVHGQIPSPPAGVFDYVKRNGQDRIPVVAGDAHGCAAQHRCTWL